MKLIGIAGGTCSGKTTLLKNLADKFGDSISVLSFDEYFIGSDLYDVNTITNFEDPKLYNFDGFIRDLRLIKQGKPLTIRANSRESAENGLKQKTIASKPVIIVEGWLIYHNLEARNLFDKKIFIDLPDEEITRRRHARTKGSRHWDSHDYIQAKIIPGHRKYVEPQKAYANLILDGTRPQEELVQAAWAFIEP